MKNAWIASWCSLLVLYSNCLLADSQAAEQIESIVRQAYSDDVPGAAVLVTKGDQVLYRGAVGMADLELGVALQPDMVFSVGSITKQFTAAAILLLEQEGKLKLSDTIDRYFPEYPKDAASTVTIKHLLNHTSGVFSYTNIPGYTYDKMRPDISVADLIELFNDIKLEFEPGSQYHYSNSGYVLLGAIVEKVSGTSYGDYVEGNIFKKLGMENTYYGRRRPIIPNRVAGYEFDEGVFTNARFVSETQPYAAGSVASTVDDLRKWDQALFSGQLLPEEAVRRMITRGELNSGERTGYGLGFNIWEPQGNSKIVAHAGGIAGFAAAVIRVIDEDLYIAILSNDMRQFPIRLGIEIAQSFGNAKFEND